MRHNYQKCYAFRASGITLGCLIFLFTAGLLSTEFGRLYAGSNNRGRNDSNVTFIYSIFPDPINYFNGNSINLKLENRWMWPWSTATLLFSLVFFATGVLGIISGQRESYSSIITFFICSLLSIFLLIFLIATYSTIIAGWKSIYGVIGGQSISKFVRIDQILSIVCLIISCLLFIIFLISLIVAGRTIDACVRKTSFQPLNEYELMTVHSA
ncbi:unnamed protein product [Rotaria socialis]|uniref:Uncharacterized protein n=2 Tax=Rotaria socialis TaxID=392032 RepID=A0A817U4Y0_9BILA|nr:unnamed protein product [Rotaria socialis]CAF4436906.1 unnamed protein product [Rotaria socialis]